MITAFLPIIANIASVLIEKLIADQKKKEEYRLAVLKALQSYNANILDSAKLRAEYDVLKSKISAGNPTSV